MKSELGTLIQEVITECFSSDGENSPENVTTALLEIASALNNIATAISAFPILTVSEQISDAIYSCSGEYNFSDDIANSLDRIAEAIIDKEGEDNDQT